MYGPIMLYVNLFGYLLKYISIYRVSQKKGGLGFGFVVVTLMSQLLIHISDNIRSFNDGQANAG